MPIKQARLFSLTMPRKPWVWGTPKDATGATKRNIKRIEELKKQGCWRSFWRLLFWTSKTSLFVIYSSSEDRSMVHGESSSSFHWIFWIKGATAWNPLKPLRMYRYAKPHKCQLQESSDHPNSSKHQVVTEANSYRKMVGKTLTITSSL